MSKTNNMYGAETFKKYFLSTPILLVIAFAIIVALFSFSAFSGVSPLAGSPDWGADVGGAGIFPACGSSSTSNPTCSGTTPSITIDWVRQDHGCLAVNVLVDGAVVSPNRACTGSFVWSGGSSNQAHTYEIRTIRQSQQSCTNGKNGTTCTSHAVNLAAPGALIYSGNFTSPNCAVPPPVTPQCGDGMDNSDPEDSLVDQLDPGCLSGPGGAYNPNDDDETDGGLPPAQCSDGVDNDGDGKTDYPGDPGCASSSDNDETDLPQCSDGIDNDGDGKVDYPADPGCSNGSDTDETDVCAVNAGTACQGPANNNCVPPISDSGVIQCDGSCSAQTPPADGECNLPTLDCGTGPADSCQKVVNKGDVCELTWTVDGASSCTVTGPGLNQTFLPPPPFDTRTITITTPTLDATALYTITCYNGPDVFVSKTFTCKMNPVFQEI